MMKIEAWVFSKIKNTRPGWIWEACFRFSVYTFWDRLRGWT